MATVKLVRPVNPRIDPYMAPASTVFAAGSLVVANEAADSNTFTAATSSSASLLGVIKKAIAATDSDYASEKLVGLLVDEDADWEFSVGTGTADANDEQGFIDLKDADEADVTQSTEDHIFVTRFIRAATLRGKLSVSPYRQPPVVR